MKAKGRSFAFASSHFRPRIFAISPLPLHILILQREGKVQVAPSVHCKKSEYLATRHPHSFIDAEINLHVDLRCFFRFFHNGFRKKIRSIRTKNQLFQKSTTMSKVLKFMFRCDFNESKQLINIVAESYELLDM